jgi:hypothetical protein
VIAAPAIRGTGLDLDVAIAAGPWRRGCGSAPSRKAGILVAVQRRGCPI